ncbi:MAG: hypothetical protein IT469_01650 [Pseudomonadales bacterium]|nr:hypothetical protein [Pseudomonadales bacterium]
MPFNANLDNTVTDRIAQDGVLIVLEAGDTADMAALYDKLDSQGVYDAVGMAPAGKLRIVGCIRLDLREHATPEAAADQAIADGQTLAAAYLAKFGSMAGFDWGVIVAADGGCADGEHPGRIPSFTNHHDDLPAGGYLLEARQFIFFAQPYTVGAGLGGDSDKLRFSNAAQIAFADSYEALNAGIHVGATITWGAGSANPNEQVVITGYTTGSPARFDFAPSTTNPNAAGDTAGITRTSSPSGIPFGGCLFFRAGIADMGAYYAALAARLASQWPGGLGTPTLALPSAWISTSEQWVASLGIMHIDFAALGATVYELNLGDALASDVLYTINGVDTLADWDADQALDADGLALTWPAPGSQYSPLAYQQMSYINWTYQAAFNRASKAAVHDNILGIFPDCYIGRYQAGSWLGTKDAPFPYQPDAGFFHADESKWAWSGALLTEAYGIGFNQWPSSNDGGSTGSFAYSQWSGSGIGWAILEAWLDYAGQPLTAAGVTAAAKQIILDRCAAMRAAATTNVIGLFVEQGPYDGVADSIGISYTYPNPALSVADGIHAPADWGDILASAVEQTGANLFVYFLPRPNHTDPNIAGIAGAMEVLGDRLSRLLEEEPTTYPDLSQNSGTAARRRSACRRLTRP